MTETSLEDRYIVGITDRVVPPADVEQKAFPEAELLFLPHWKDGEEGREEWRRVDALLVWRRVIDRDTVALLDRCRIVVRYGVGYDEFDLAALDERNIPACNTPDYGTEEVADTAAAMILTLHRNVMRYNHECRRITSGWGGYAIKSSARTSTRTLGVVGVGRIGTALVNRMKPFGFTIVGYDPYQVPGHEKAVGYTRADSLDELLECADIVTLHCPLNEETEGMVDGDFLSRMKEGSSLVNTARGKILKDLDCLEESLTSGHLASAALDVLPDEPPQEHSLIRAWRKGDELLGGRLLITPHKAFYSTSAFYDMRYKAAETARLYLTAGRLRNQVTS